VLTILTDSVPRLLEMFIALRILTLLRLMSALYQKDVVAAPDRITTATSNATMATFPVGTV